LMAPAAGTGARLIGRVSVNVPGGYVDTFMIRPSNCTLRWLWSLWIVAICTVNVAAITHRNQRSDRRDGTLYLLV
jgi:hypothetical protein